MQDRLNRKKLLIYPQFQLLMIATNLATYFLTFFGIYYFFSESYLFIALLFGAAFSSAVTLVLSNKLAGPIVRLHIYFKSISDGQRNIPAVFFRKGDFFNTLPPLINSAVDKMKEEKDVASGAATIKAEQKKAA